MALTLIFTLGEETYGLEIEAIQEIVEDAIVHYVPRAAGILTGAINFHGRILPVIDLPRLLGFPGEQRSHRRLVLTAEHNALVLTVSGVERIVELENAVLQPPPPAAVDKAIRVVAEHEERRLYLLDTDAICTQLETLQL